MMRIKQDETSFSAKDARTEKIPKEKIMCCGYTLMAQLEVELKQWIKGSLWQK